MMDTKEHQRRKKNVARDEGVPILRIRRAQLSGECTVAF
jgi:hypothetical protein